MAGVFEMVEKRIEALQSIQSKIDSLPKEEERTEEYPVRRAPDVVLFFSFDIVNSTAYKTINYYGWAQVLNLLFKELRRDVGNQIKSSEMWRLLGDVLLENADNIFERYQSPEGHDIFEFLGNDIDTGFRIARHTEEGRICPYGLFIRSMLSCQGFQAES